MTAYRDDERALHERLAILDRIAIATPCDAGWDAMSGDDRVRHCALCDRKVYDVSALTSAEAIALLESSGEALPCVRLHRRRDGTLITRDCRRGTRRRKRHLAIAGAAVLAGTALATAGPTNVAGALLPPPFDPDAVDRQSLWLDHVDSFSTEMGMWLILIPADPPASDSLACLDGHCREESR